MSQQKLNRECVEKTGADNAKLPYHTPVLQQYGEIAAMVKSSPLPGSDGTGGFPTDAGS